MQLLIEKRRRALEERMVLGIKLINALKQGDDVLAEQLLAQRAVLKGEIRALDVAIQVAAAEAAN